MIASLKSAIDLIFKDHDPRRTTRRQREIEAYLAESVDRYDLERRERELERKGMFW
jgi:hypothetical protein